MRTANNVWANLLNTILMMGLPSRPRGFSCTELLHHTVVMNMRYPVVVNQLRSLNYRFMAAEAHWILTGDDRVETIAPYNSRMANFSDDGQTFFGAYGPKIVGQLDYVISKLCADPYSRQAGINIWRENPPETKDVPCTVSIFFSVRDNYLNAHVFMRSSDAWLGFPYDVFNFSMLAHLVCCRLNHDSRFDQTVEPGSLYLTMANSHLYEPNKVDAGRCVEYHNKAIGEGYPQTPDVLWESEHELFKTLREIKDGSVSLRWWSLA